MTTVDRQSVGVRDWSATPAVVVWLTVCVQVAVVLEVVGWIR